MPIHDWTRVDDGIFHDFHVAWIGELRRVLNSGLLPPDYYALAEQVAGSRGPDVLPLHTPASQANGNPAGHGGTLALATAPPRGDAVYRAEINEYTQRQRTVVIRHSSNHRIIALIEILSAGNKASRHAMRSFLEKACAALARGIHLLLIDLHPPGPRGPAGIHAAIWQHLGEESLPPRPDKPLTAARCVGGVAPTAYVVHLAVGDALPDMALFLGPEEYINVPLGATYQAAYAGVPRFYRNLLEG